MLSTRNPGLGLLLMLLCGVLAAGCPRGDVGATLLVSPEVMDFGTTRTQMLLTVNKNITSTPADGPVVVTSSAPWIIPERCGDVTDDCNSRGPFNKLRIPVRVDRSLTKLGMNTGILSVHARGTAIERVTVQLEDLLQADFSVDMREVDAGQPVNFTDETVSSAEAGLIVGRQWNFGDGGTSTATNPSHTYTQPGIYDVSLTITTPTTVETFTRESYITVRGMGPAVAFEGTPTTLPAGNSVTFTDRSTSTLGTVDDWFWQFGDGGTSRLQDPVHTYELPGVYAVSLRASTQFGTATLTKSAYITLLANLPGVAEFTHEPLRPRANQAVKFFDLSNPGSTPITAWLWNFGDGQTSIARDPVHTFATAGSFDVSLTITTALGESTKVRTVVVTSAKTQAASKDAAGDSDCAPAGESVDLAFLPGDGLLPVAHWSWDFGDGARYVSFDEGQPGALVQVFQMDAQQGPVNAAITDGSPLAHTVTIAVPDSVSSSTALLFVHDESLGSETLPNDLASLAAASGMVVALIDSISGPGAATAIVRAMDTVQSYLGAQPPVDGFILIDAAVDGQATALEEVPDCRVHAVAPIPAGILSGD